jgi:hypothetical protein
MAVAFGAEPDGTHDKDVRLSRPHEDHLLVIHILHGRDRDDRGGVFRAADGGELHVYVHA